MNKAVFLDRDGTINVDRTYLSKIDDFEYLPGAIEGLRLLQFMGYMLIIITNQSGIARGYYTEKEFLRLNNWMIEDLRSKDVVISHVYYCPHYLDGLIEKYRVDCDCRKPKLGMFNRSITDFNIDVAKSYVIGDRIRDLSICEKTSCHGYLISNLERSEIIDAVKLGLYKNISYSLDLFDASKKIAELSKGQN